MCTVKVSKRMDDPKLLQQDSSQPKPRRSRISYGSHSQSVINKFLKYKNKQYSAILDTKQKWWVMEIGISCRCGWKYLKFILKLQQLVMEIYFSLDSHIQHIRNYFASQTEKELWLPNSQKSDYSLQEDVIHNRIARDITRLKVF